MMPAARRVATARGRVFRSAAPEYLTDEGWIAPPDHLTFEYRQLSQTWAHPANGLHSGR